MTARSARGLWRRQAALPSEHGAWVFLLSPLLIGFAAGARDAAGAGAGIGAVALLATGALAAFLLRTPLSLAVKAVSGRRPRADLPVALAWAAVYGGLGLAAAAGLAALGHGRLLWLAAPAGPVFGWHLWLISRRAERRQLLVEVVGSGVLALAAPAAYWLHLGPAQPMGWWLWLLCWAQSAASIVYAYLRLAQRGMPAAPPLAARLAMGAPALLFTSLNLAGAVGLALAGVLPPLVPLAFGVQWAESVYGSLVPAVGARPVAIGLRQLAVSVIFTLVFIAAWLL